MSKQIFKFGQPAEQALTDFIALNNPGFTLPAADLIFGVPSVVTAPTVDCAVQGASDYHGINVSGSVTLTYNRLDLGQYFQGVTPTLDASSGTDNASLLAALLNRYQLYFTTDAAGNDAYSQGSFSINNLTSPPTATLTASASNLIWQGNVTFNLGGEWSLVSILPNVAMTTLGLEPQLSEGQSYAEAYYGTNFQTVDQETALAALTTGAIPTQTAGTPWAIGVAITSDAWVFDNTQVVPFNISGAVVAYNGVAEGDWALSPALAAQYTNVCVITLAVACANLVGNLIIPYNVSSSPAPTPSPTPN